MASPSEQWRFLRCKLLLKSFAALRYTDFSLNATVRYKKISLSNKREVDHTQITSQFPESLMR